MSSSENDEETDTSKECIANRIIKICVECESEYLACTSKMMQLCPECASILYGYDNCQHVFKNGKCTKCLWDGSRSDYILWLLEDES